MRQALVVLCVVALPAVVRGQELPRVTPEASRAAQQLVDACKKAGALKIETDPRTRAIRTVVADETKLAAIIRQQARTFTPAMRDALLRYHEQPGVMALLLGLGHGVGDDLAVVYGKFFTARLQTEQLTFEEARKNYEQAAVLF